MLRLTKRKEYLEVARGARTPRRGFLLQSAPQRPPVDARASDGSAPDGRASDPPATDCPNGGPAAPARSMLSVEPAAVAVEAEKPRAGAGALPSGAAQPARFGFTVTKKIGNAVVRNRIRRRLKEAVRLHGALAARPGTDYVLVGRRAALDQPFDELVADVVGAIKSASRPRDGSDEHRSRREQKRSHHG